eukprot:gnl/MRDRNA2_/MRDRNA2_143660_c0_seq1.p1 gnl/MRDRNA2_/MRDRNA2_143660_c0~~gnl/MRDRNA2_/MRDRNA2_143660_c0_seq1.p1  ORF type:complete len:279 (-),score=53.68 gnl/MRDRNA2_/MRDRNA2_143660_c0_seq1:729-1565(-)
MRRFNIIILVAFIVQANTNELTHDRADKMRNLHSDIFIDTLVDKLSQRLFTVAGGAKHNPSSLFMHRGMPSFQPSPRMRQINAAEGEGTATEAKDTAQSTTTAGKDLKDKPLPGSGVNLFDPAASASRWLTRRFGIVGGLGLVAGLALIEGNEFLQAILEDINTKDVTEIEEKTLPDGRKYRDLKLGGGNGIKNGDFVGVNLVIKSGGQVVLDTKAKKKPIAFVYGEPAPGYPGLEEGVKGMRRGGVRTISFPPASDGSSTEYTIEIQEVSPAYFTSR